jgi:hypothetical protein
MAHFAKVENGFVTQVIVAEQSDIDSLPDASSWVQTSYNTFRNQHKLGGTPLRGNYAGIGYKYDATNDVFYEKQPYPSYVLNETTWSWDAPIPRPSDSVPYNWNEDTQTWDQVIYS